MPSASADRPSVPIVTATIVIFAPNDRSSHMMRFDALPTKLRLCRMLLRMGIIALFETVAFSALRFFSKTDKFDLLISSSSYAQVNNITCSSLVADSTKTFAHSISCFLLIRFPFGASNIYRYICSSAVISGQVREALSTTNDSYWYTRSRPKGGLFTCGRLKGYRTTSQVPSDWPAGRAGDAAATTEEQCYPHLHPASGGARF